MVNLREDTRESIAKLTLMDDIFMNKVFENDTERTALLLRIILNNDKIKVIKAVTQQKLKNLQGHDLQLDILAQEENGRLFNVEVQNRSSGAAARRARYHLSLLDAHSLPKGEVYQKLPDNYVIFITQYDVLKGGLPIYHINRKIEENNVAFADGSHIIYVNNKIKDNTPLGRLMHDFNCTNPNDMYYPELAEKARYFKETEKGLTNMGDVFEKFVAKREKEAAMKAAEKAAEEAQANRIELAKGLLADGMSIEFTVRHSKLSEAEVRELASKLTA
ncbi:Rpn family recombination-promoting nuclease/putative transposase [Phascolarctobacterium succinatutens]|uniref:Rpn family recombination-promoting nuclease/putative transposase n=1 Tax=Phascolarctobacterium succinatutens TaxID=626940 RepID=UPI0026F2DA8F|nr:Rpn family recombination-promoting nuclease/putative transposase [Phascolarctobacterium succinatutens]